MSTASHRSSRSPSAPSPSDPRAASRVCVVVGLQWGDEGKGKIVDLLAADSDLVCRYNGGANAGHSVVIEGQRHALHLIPSGLLRRGVVGLIGPGVVVHPPTLVRELEALQGAGVDCRLLRIASTAHVVMPWHIEEDRVREAALAKGDSAPIGTTLRGIGPAYAEKMQRALAVRVADLLDEERLRAKVRTALPVKQATLTALDPQAERFDEETVVGALLACAERLAPHVVDGVRLLHEALAQGKRVLFEGANGTLLDVDHGAYPFVTSSSASALGVGPGAGVPAAFVSDVLGVVKAYCTRVGAGPFPTEEQGPAGQRLRERGREFGTTTGRPRRCGWLDLVALRYAARLNGVTGLAVTLLDVLAGFDELKLCVAYDVDGERTDWFPADAWALSRARPVYETMPGFAEEIRAARALADLPRNARRYLERVEEAAQAPVRFVSVGPDREETIVL